MENCKCGQNKVRTEVDGRFVYQVCNACDDVIQVVYLGPKEEADDDISSEMLGL